MGSFPVLKGVWESTSSESLVLDGERGELVRARMGKKGGGGGGGGGGGDGGVSDERAVMALKSHSEAERRRRERINGHLATLRSMVPCSSKLDKAALLAEVINHVKKLKSNALEISKGCIIPSDADEVRVDVVGDGDGLDDGMCSIKASLSCEDRPDLLADLRQTLQPLQLKMVRAEISTLGGRVKHDFVITCKESAEQNLSATNIRQALKSVLDRATTPEFVPRTSFPSKRRRISQLEPSFSSLC